MRYFKQGDLIAKKHCATKDLLQIGVVLRSTKESFDIQWTWYNKTFFMEKEGDIFKELNNQHLLTTVTYTQEGANPLLCRLGDSYCNGTQTNSDGPNQRTYQTDIGQH